MRHNSLQFYYRLFPWRFAGQVPFIADGSFEVFVGRLVVAAFFKAFAKRFALALLGKVCRLLRLLVERLAIF